jgi:hypothetical protein
MAAEAEILMRNGNGRSGDVGRHLFERRSSGNTGTLQTMGPWLLKAQ